MRRRTKIKLNPKYVLIVCVVFLIGLIVFSYRYSDKLSPVEGAVGTVITPMQRGVNTIGTYISSQLNNFKNVNKLIKENKKLKDQVDTLSYQNKVYLQDKYELDNLRKLYKLDQQYADYPKVGARVISKDSNNWYNTFKIDKGRKDGIKVNMNVIAGNGLVGIVTKVHYNYSLVRAIIDDNSKVGGMFSKTSDRCIVEGDLQLIDQGKIRVSHIVKDAKINEGDEVYTSQDSSKFLQGILIGYVSDIKMDSNNMSKTALLTPVADFQHLEEVLIITKLREPLK